MFLVVMQIKLELEQPSLWLCVKALYFQIEAYVTNGPADVALPRWPRHLVFPSVILRSIRAADVH